MMLMVVMVVMMVKKLTCSSYISSITPALCWSGTKSGVHCNNVWCASIYFSAFYGIVYTVLYSVMILCYTVWCTLCTCTLCKEENPGIVALHWLRSLCGLHAALWDTGTGTVEGWLGNLDTIWIHFPVWISPEPQQIIFLSNSNCLHFLSDNAGDQIHCRSILPKNLQNQWVLIVWLTRAGWELQRVQK